MSYTTNLPDIITGGVASATTTEGVKAILIEAVWQYTLAYEAPIIPRAVIRHAHSSKYFESGILHLPQVADDTDDSDDQDNAEDIDDADDSDDQDNAEDIADVVWQLHRLRITVNNNMVNQNVV